MIKNYLIIAIRRLIGQKIYSTINALGLVIGISCSILILLFIQDELRHAHFHPNGHRIIKVLWESTLTDGKNDFHEWLSGGIAPALQEHFPEIEHAARTTTTQETKTWVQYDKTIRQLQVSLADLALLDIFAWKMANGRPPPSQLDSGSVLITENVAEIYFGHKNPIGKILTVEDAYLGGQYRIAGILQNPSPYSHLQFDIFLNTVPTQAPSIFSEGWQGQISQLQGPAKIYLRLKEGTAPKELEQKCPDILAQFIDPVITKTNTLRFQPVNRAYLYSRVDYGLPQGGDIIYIYQLSAMALFVLAIACINFMNLETARAASRAKEVGLRKVIGANRSQLIQQFIGESILFSLLAALISFGVAIIALPTFNDLVDRQLVLNISSNSTMLIGVLAITGIIGAVAGSYPALFLSNYQPAHILSKTPNQDRSRGLSFQKISVVFQFILSVGLLICTDVIYTQNAYMKHRDFGFHKDLIVIAPTIFANPALGVQFQAIKKAFRQHSNITNTTASWPYPGSIPVRRNVSIADQEESWQFQVLGIDEDFIDTYGLQLVEGRKLNFDIMADRIEAFLINESAAHQIGWTDPIGQRITVGKREGTIIGVIKDFHYRSLHHPIEPMVLFNWTPISLSINIRSENIPQTMDFLKQTWEKIIPNQPPDFYFLNEKINRAYEAQDRQAQSFATLSVLAILIACLGVFGLSTFTAQNRTREIGMRKTFGASTMSIIVLILKDFIRLVIIANIIVAPVAYALMDDWLQNFAYRINLGSSIFLFACGISLVVAILSASYQTIKAARAKPVDSLQHA